MPVQQNFDASLRVGTGSCGVVVVVVVGNKSARNRRTRLACDGFGFCCCRCRCFVFNPNLKVGRRLKYDLVHDGDGCPVGPTEMERERKRERESGRTSRKTIDHD